MLQIVTDCNEREKKERDLFPLWLGLSMAGVIGSLLWIVYILR